MFHDEEFQAIVEVFAAEAAENLAAMEAALLELETHPADAERVAVVFRVVHTLKGDAGNLGFAPVAAFAHVVEDLLDRVRDAAHPVSAECVGILIEACDALREMVPAALAGAPAISAEHEALRERIADAAAGDFLFAPTLAEATGAAAGAPQAAGPTRARTLRVGVEKLDRTLDLVGEIAIARGRIAQMLEDGRPAADVLEAHREADRLHMELQEVVMKLRMVPLGPVLRPYARSVRDVAQAHGKVAQLVIESDDVEMDTSVVEQLRDPLTHMVRNAVDHGIEMPEARLRAGKDACGTVTMRARHEGGSILLQVSDDGGGLSRARIAARARAAGLHADPERLPDAELFRMIFEPGFSTAETVTDLSGRGVGMDVVRRTVDALRGTLAVESREGAGTCITLRLPLTLAVIEGFSVRSAGETYVIPLDAVGECVEFPAVRQGADQLDGLIALRGEPLPFIRLSEFMGTSRVPRRRESVVVIRHEGTRIGLVVDTLLGEGQVVIKPLGRLFQNLPGISGSTILGSGRIALILDLPSLVREALRARVAVPHQNDFVRLQRAEHP
jgi:two-component system chemotaxis sensor kinase CheA